MLGMICHGHSKVRVPGINLRTSGTRLERGKMAKAKKKSKAISLDFLVFTIDVFFVHHELLSKCSRYRSRTDEALPFRFWVGGM